MYKFISEIGRKMRERLFDAVLDCKDFAAWMFPTKDGVILVTVDTREVRVTVTHSKGKLRRKSLNIQAAVEKVVPSWYAIEDEICEDASIYKDRKYFSQKRQAA